jgi:hypothetical protein
MRRSKVPGKKRQTAKAAPPFKKVRIHSYQWMPPVQGLKVVLGKANSEQRRWDHLIYEALDKPPWNMTNEQIDSLHNEGTLWLPEEILAHEKKRAILLHHVQLIQHKLAREPADLANPGDR